MSLSSPAIYQQYSDKHLCNSRNESKFHRRYIATLSNENANMDLDGEFQIFLEKHYFGHTTHNDSEVNCNKNNGDMNIMKNKSVINSILNCSRGKCTARSSSINSYNFREENNFARFVKSFSSADRQTEEAYHSCNNQYESSDNDNNGSSEEDNHDIGYQICDGNNFSRKKNFPDPYIFFPKHMIINQLLVNGNSNRM